MNRLIKIYLAFSGVVIAVLIAVVVLLVFQTNTAVDRANKAITAVRQTAVLNCLENNVARQQDIAIWNRLLTVSSPPSAAVKAEIADLNALVKIKDTPRPCGP